MLSDYEILGVRINATPQEIKKAYFTLAKRYHPDLSRLPRAEAEVKMAELNEAYSRLSQGQTQEAEVGVMYADPTNPSANLAYHYANENVQRLCMKAMQKLIDLNNNEALEKLRQQFYEDTSYTVGRLIAVGVMEPLTAELYSKTLEHFNNKSKEKCT